MKNGSGLARKMMWFFLGVPGEIHMEKYETGKWISKGPEDDPWVKVLWDETSYKDCISSLDDDRIVQTFKHISCKHKAKPQEENSSL